jgi:3-methyladenine DNA glycosylase AlkD
MEPTATAFEIRLNELQAPGRSMANLFQCAKEFTSMSLAELNLMLDRDEYEMRMGAVCIMDFQARAKKTTPERKRKLFELYMGRHDRFKEWDIPDRAAPHVVGAYLFDKPRDVLYELARAEDPIRKRTAIVATWYFIKNGQLDDTFALADILAQDPDPLVHLAVGSWVREAGKRDSERLLAFLDRHAATMPRAGLRYAIEKLPPPLRQHYMSK